MKLSIGVMGCTTIPKYFQEVKSILNTWVPECWENGIPVYLFVGEKIAEEEKLLNTQYIIHLEGVGDDYNSASEKQWLGYKYLYDNVPSDFYMIVGTDNYVWWKNLSPIIEKYNPNNAFLIGGYGEVRIFDRKQQYFPFGGAGLILTHEALKRLYPRLTSLFSEWRKFIGMGDLIPACDVAIAYYAEQYNIVICRDYGLYSQDWLGNGKWGRVNEGVVNYDNAAVFHYMNEENIRLYHKYRDVAKHYYQLYNLSIQHPHEISHDKSVTHITFTENDSLSYRINSIKRMLDFSDGGLTISGNIDDEIKQLATFLGITVI